MRVKEVYQDDEGNWHIDYGLDHLIGLSIRVWFGGFFLYLKISIYIIIFGSLSAALLYLLSNFDRDNYSPKDKNHSSLLNVQLESINNKQLYLD